jgi:dienelactone hydrolase
MMSPIRTFVALFAGTLALVCMPARSQEFRTPQSGKGPAVILISGVSGTALYQDYARAVAALGYTAILVSGRDISNQENGSSDNLKRVISTSQADPRVVPGKVAVIGFSLGGGGALLHAAHMQEPVAAVVAYYPAVTRLPSIEGAAKRVAVPTLILAGEKDRYNNCCLIESIREFAATAQAANRQVEVVTYPNADHGFNLNVRAFRADDSADAWVKVQAVLSKHLPLN